MKITNLITIFYKLVILNFPSNATLSTNMKTNIFRTILALVISITGVFFSYYFLYPHTEQKKSAKNLVAMARVLTAINDVKKQGINKLIWEPVRKGDLLYLGEKLKTSTSSSSKIEFIENGASIDIEQDSLIVVSKSNKKLSLQVVEGSLFVSSNKNIAGLNVTSGNKSENAVNLKNGDFSFSVSKEGKANLEVLKGSIEGQSQLVSQNSQKFKDIFPSYGETIFISDKNDDGNLIKWKSIGSDYEIILLMGTDRNNLSPVKDIFLDKEQGLIRSKAKLGTHYWKLVAKNLNNSEDQFTSNTFKVTFKSKSAPIPIYPLANEFVQLKNATDQLEFRWNLLHHFDSVKLEIYNEDRKGSPILSEIVTNQTQFTTNKINKPGKYNWKLIGKFANDEVLLVSQIQSFSLIFGDELPSPALLSPEDKSTFFYSNSKNNHSVQDIQLTWQNIKQATQYLVTLKNSKEEKKEFKVLVNELSIPTLGEGKYSWSVQSINQKNDFSTINSTRLFQIEPMKDLVFKEFSKNVYYVTQFPNIKISWNKIGNISNYKLIISKSQSLTPNETFNISEDHFNYQIGNEGVYFMQVEAINKLDRPIAQTSIATFTVSKPPLPPMPKFINLSKGLEANAAGDILFEIGNLDKKHTVIFEINDKTGNLIDQKRLKQSKVFFKSLPPGPLFISAKFIDEYNQAGESSERHPFVVPEKSSIAAPKLKGVKVR
jgi:hypothetical protein